MATKTKSASPPPVEYASGLDKVRDEMAKSKDQYTRIVGEYLTDWLLAHPDAEAAILDRDKSIKGSLEAVRAEAQKVRTGNMAVLDDQTVFGIVLGYFGIKPEPEMPKNEGNVPKTGANVPGETTGGTTSSAPAGAPAPSGEGFREPQTPAPADYASACVGEIAAAMGRHAEGQRKGEIIDRHPDFEAAPDPVDPFDLDALLGGLG